MASYIRNSKVNKTGRTLYVPLTDALKVTDLKWNDAVTVIVENNGDIKIKKLINKPSKR